jgi:hypothetical protein
VCSAAYQLDHVIDRDPLLALAALGSGEDPALVARPRVGLHVDGQWAHMSQSRHRGAHVVRGQLDVPAQSHGLHQRCGGCVVCGQPRRHHPAVTVCWGRLLTLGGVRA